MAKEKKEEIEEENYYEETESEEIVKDKKEYKITDLPGVGPAVATKLAEAGVTELMNIAVLTPPELSDMSGVSEAVARKIIQASRKMLDLGFQTASDFSKSRKEINHISTGSKNVNELLGGRGLESKAITEVYGAYGSGKTQLALSLAVNVQLPYEKGGCEGKAVYIDTEGTFKPDRVKEIAVAAGLDAEKALKNILIARAFNSDHQMLLVDKVGDLIKNGENIKLLVVDSVTSHFRAEFAGRGTLADRQQKINKHMHDLMKTAEQYNLVVYITNQVMANPAQMFGDPTTAIGGNIIGHASTYRMYFRRGKAGSRVAKMIDAPNLPENETMFYLTKAGLRDEDKE
jgi:DNA repair protein RadA